MLYQAQTFARQSIDFVVDAFFALTKALLAALILTAGVLAVAQSSVSPVSVRLLSSYAMEYAVRAFKPYRPYFPEPYLIQFENQ